jgi:peptide/nickel transport system permease protein
MLLTRLKLGDWIASFATGTLLCVPAALLAVLAAYIGAPPAIAIAAVLFPRIFRYVRNLARQASGAPHVLAAHALGLSKVRILRYHVVTPILPELLALAGASVSMAVAALIPVEALCDSPGVGQLIWQAALARDVPVLVNVTLLIAGLTIAANLLADTARAARQAAI